MYPRGSGGSAQGLIDARVLADLLRQHGWWPLCEPREDALVGSAARVVGTN